MISIPIFLMLISTSIPQECDPGQYLWKNRLLIVVSPGSDLPDASEQYRMFAKNPEENKDRELLLLTLTRQHLWNGNTLTSTPPIRWRTHFQIPPEFSGVLLIGKDGKVKLRQEGLTTPRSVYEQIDQMPMRRQEIKKRN